MKALLNRFAKDEFGATARESWPDRRSGLGRDHRGQLRLLVPSSMQCGPALVPRCRAFQRRRNWLIFPAEGASPLPFFRRPNLRTHPGKQ